MPHHVVDLVAQALNSVGRAVRGSRVHLFGMAYKPNVSDWRESPAIDVAQLLEQRGAIVSYSDPHVLEVSHGEFRMTAIPQEDAFEHGVDCAVITTDHRAFDCEAIAARSPLVVDTRNAVKTQAPHVFRL
jgi:UDP-N-acetyl-D-glucosamine dehydrogenase